MNARLKQVLKSLLIGVAITALTVFLEGLVDILQGYENNILGGVASSYNALKFLR